MFPQYSVKWAKPTFTSTRIYLPTNIPPTLRQGSLFFKQISTVTSNLERWVAFPLSGKTVKSFELFFWSLKPISRKKFPTRLLGIRLVHFNSESTPMFSMFHVFCAMVARCNIYMVYIYIYIFIYIYLFVGKIRHNEQCKISIMSKNILMKIDFFQELLNYLRCTGWRKSNFTIFRTDYTITNTAIKMRYITNKR